MNDSTTNKIIRISVVLLLLTIIAIGVKIISPQFNRAKALERERTQVQEQIAEKQREIEKLKDNQRRFRDDPDFVESIARKNKRVFPGEVVFVYGDK